MLSVQEIIANSLSSATKLVGYVAVAIIIILLAVSIFLITNTIVIGITVRKDEIFYYEIYWCNRCICKCSIFVEGITIGIIGSIIPLIFLWYMYQNIIGFVVDRFSILSNIFSIYEC